MRSARSAVLVGASGLVGTEVLHLLLQRTEYEQVVALVRKPLTVSHFKLKQHVIGFEELEEHRNLVAGEDIFCCLGTTIRAAGSQAAFRRVDYDYVVQLATLASANGSEQFLMISSLGASAQSRVFYSRVKGEVERAVSAIPFQAIHIFRPSMLLGQRAESRPGEKAGIVAMNAVSFAMVGPWRKFRPIHAHTVASAMVRVAAADLRGVNIFESDKIQALGSSS